MEDAWMGGTTEEVGSEMVCDLLEQSVALIHITGWALTVLHFRSVAKFHKSISH